MSRTLLSVNVQPVILSTAGAKPTVPANPNAEPHQTGWLSTDIMRGEVAYNSADDIYWYRTYVDKIVWAGGQPVQKAYGSGTIELDFSYPERAELDLYELGNLSFSLSDDSPLNAEFTKVFTVIGDDTSTVSFTEDFEDIDEYNFAYFNNKKYNKIMMYIDNGVVFVGIRTMTSLGPGAGDVTPPTLSNFAVTTATPKRITFNSSEVITGTTFAGFAIAGFTIDTLNIAAGATTGHYFEVTENIVEGDSLEITYDGTDDWEDTSENALASFGATAITNSVDNPDITAASVEDAEPSDFVFTAERAITGTTAGWTPKINGTPATKTGFSGSGTTTITITVSETVENGDTLTFDYSGGDMVDTYGNVMQTITGQSVTNNVAVGTIILFEDDFAGTTIDTGKWTVTDPADDVVISQNDELIFTTQGTGSVGWQLNNMDAIYNIPESSFACAIDSVALGGGHAKNRGMSIRSAAGTTVLNIRGRDVSGASGIDVLIRDSLNNNLVNLTQFAVTLEGKTWRLSIESDTLKVSYWNGSSWTDLVTQAMSGNVDSDLFMRITCGDAFDGFGENQTTFGKARITSETYATQYPV